MSQHVRWGFESQAKFPKTNELKGLAFFKVIITGAHFTVSGPDLTSMGISLYGDSQIKDSNDTILTKSPESTL